MLTPEQKAIRATGIGGSDIGALVGLNPYKSAIDVYLEKTGAVEPVDDKDNFHIQRGVHLEPGVRTWYEARTGRHVRLPDPLTLRSPTHPYVLASPDGIAGHPTGPVREIEKLCALEIKFPSWRTADDWGEPGTDQIPKMYVPQTMFEAHVCGVIATDAAAVIAGDLCIYTVPFNEQLFEHLADAAARFMVNHVIPRRPPPPDASKKYAEHLAKSYPKAEEIVLPATAQASSAAEDLRLLRLRASAIDDEITLAENRLKAMIGGAKAIETDAGKISWVTVNKSVVDWESIARARGATDADMAPNSKAITYRQFIVPRKWSK